MTFRATKPARRDIEAVLAASKEIPCSYPGAGFTRDGAARGPAGYRTDRATVILGRGRDCYQRAREAIAAWKMFPEEIEIVPERSPIETGRVVAVVLRTFGIWSANGCRIVYTIDETGSTDRFGFAYGTLASHAERGEERFLVQWRHDDDVVSYDLHAVSRPGHVVTWLGFPLVRLLQARFRRDSCAAMKAAVTERP
ncbi:MAG: DUF1990 domain-containing protein [Acidobacteriota bacterium]